MNNENLFTAALNALTQKGCPSDLAQEAAFIVANDDPYQPDLGRTQKLYEYLTRTERVEADVREFKSNFKVNGERLGQD